MTKTQYCDGSKDVTRRIGWKRLRRGDILMGVEKAMGLKKGEEVVRLGALQVLDVRREPLDAITQDDCRREGFPDMTPQEFVLFFMKGHGMKDPKSTVTRIEFRRLSDAESQNVLAGTIGKHRNRVCSGNATSDLFNALDGD